MEGRGEKYATVRRETGTASPVLGRRTDPLPGGQRESVDLQNAHLVALDHRSGEL